MNNHEIDFLKNKTYIGYSLQNKTNRISHKNHSQVNVPEDEWIVDENHHKPIIKEEYFNQVQLLLYSGSSRANIKGDMPLFSGFLKCKDVIQVYGDIIIKRETM